MYSGAPSHRTYCVEVNRLVGERPEELRRRDQPGDGPVPEPGQRAQTGIDLGQLRNVIGGQVEAIPRGEDLGGGVTVPERAQRRGHGRPDLVLDIGVLDGGGGRVDAGGLRRDLVATGPVRRGWVGAVDRHHPLMLSPRSRTVGRSNAERDDRSQNDHCAIRSVA